MKIQILSGLLALSSVATANPVCRYITPARAQQVKNAFSAAKITPDVVPSISPKVDVLAAYGTTQVNLGNEITTLQTVPEPDFTFTAEPGYDPTTTKYFKFIIDPDAPGPEGTIQNPLTALLSDFLHLAVQDASPNCVDPKSAGKTVRMYLAPTPLSVASHRYIFLVYRQPPGFQAPLDLALTIQGFTLNQFVQKYGLTLVGGNYYLQGLGTNLGGGVTGSPI